MPESEITKLRRARLRVHRQLAKLEPLVADYNAKLADLEARIQELAPEMRLSPRFHKPDPIFARGEMRRVVLGILREAGEPLSIAVIAVRALAQKGHTLPGPTLRKRTRHKIRNALIGLDKRRVTVRVGEGREAKRGLTKPT